MCVAPRYRLIDEAGNGKPLFRGRFPSETERRPGVSAETELRFAFQLHARLLHIIINPHICRHGLKNFSVTFTGNVPNSGAIRPVRQPLSSERVWIWARWQLRPSPVPHSAIQGPPSQAFSVGKRGETPDTSPQSTSAFEHFLHFNGNLSRGGGFPL